MMREISTQPSPGGSLLKFFATVFLVSAALYPMLTASVLFGRERKLTGVAHWLKRSFEFEQISAWRTNAPTNLPMPFVGRFLVRNDRVVR